MPDPTADDPISDPPISDPWDLGHLDTLETRPAGQGRLHLGAMHPGPAVLMVHGGYHGAWCWVHMLRRLGVAGIAAAAVDLRGHGGLPQGPAYPRQGMWDMAGDVAAAAAVLGRPVVLVGHSLGALVAAAAARDVAPAGLVLMAPSPPGNQPGVMRVDPFPDDRPVPPPAGEAARRRFLAGWSGGGMAAFEARLCAESPAFLNDRYQCRIAVDASWVKGPSLCLAAGLESGALHPPGQDEGVARFFGADFREFPEAGHDMMLDDHRDAVADHIIGWLRAKAL